MGIDVSTCGSGVGLFTSSQGCGVKIMPDITNFSMMMKVIGAVSFIRALLLMAGVEPNPGPADTLIFRYEYLLIEIGTEMLRMLFNKLVGNDFMQYLNTNPTEYNQLMFLINSNIIKEQKQVLPPIDKTPTAANFDITLLACLLRNVCGLSGINDRVWKIPAPGNLTVEADITRLRRCRNNVLHSGTVFVSESVFTNKWQELCVILNRLSTSCGMTNLPALINDAESMDLDEELKKRLEKTLKAWEEAEQLFDHGIEGLKLGQSELKDGHSEIKHDLEDVKSQLQILPVMKESMEKMEESQAKLMQEIKTQSATKSPVENLEQSPREHKHFNDADIRDILKKNYKKNCCTLKVSPLCGDDEDKIELLKIYQPPTLNHLPYLRNRQEEGNYPISSYKEIFLKDDKCFRNIYITGDAGVGKTSFCQCMSLLWCLSGEKIGNDILQNGVDFMAKFEFVFYISLTETVHEDIIYMIIDKFLYTKSSNKKEEIIQSIEDILQEKDCLIILDGLDEWTPNTSDRNKCALPRRIPSETCTYLTTCRPYELENTRLSNNDIDHQIQMTGIHKQSSVFFVKEIVSQFNKVNHANKNADDFLREVEECGLADQISIPMVASQLVALWYRQKLTDMSRALIYSKIVDMLFERAEMKAQIELSDASVSELELSDFFAELPYLNKYASLLRKLCSLSFRSLFEQKKSVLIFTKHQLMSKPYEISPKEMNFLCKLGILSKNKFIGRRCEEKEQKLSFIHKSYLEFLAALFVSSFDPQNKLIDDVVKKWTTLNDVVQYDSFLLFLAGFLCDKIKPFFENVYQTISDDLSICRRNVLVHHDHYLLSCTCRRQFVSLQNIVFNCFNEVNRSSVATVFLKLEDIIFTKYPVFATLESFLLGITSCVKSIHIVGLSYSELAKILKQSSNVSRVLSSDYEKLTRCMLQNQSTLHTVCIEGDNELIQELPVSRLQHLASLSLSKIKMSHYNLHNLVKFLSGNALMENIQLYQASCQNHFVEKSGCTFTLNLLNHTKLTSLCLYGVNIVCENVNTSRLQCVKLCSLPERIVHSYVGLFDCIRDSQLEHLNISGYNVLDYNTVKSLTSAVNTLPNIKSLRLEDMNLPADIVLLLHPDVTKANIEMQKVIMSPQCFKSIVNHKSKAEVELNECKITSVDGETPKELSEKESLDYMCEYLAPIPNIYVKKRGNNNLMISFSSLSLALRSMAKELSTLENAL